ncbi:MAG: hypothetical protein WCI73_20105, partial [Phycisphaerae bacterium]
MITQIPPTNSPIADPLAHILALETSGRVGSVALGIGPRMLAVRHFSHGMRHAVALLPMIQEMITAQGWRPQ